jgi:Acetyltransferase (GNAT) domain
VIGEGTGKRIDLDWFDSHYLHLVLWNGERHEIVGSYRCGTTDTIVPRFGADGLYTCDEARDAPAEIALPLPTAPVRRSVVRKNLSPGSLLLVFRSLCRMLPS